MKYFSYCLIYAIFIAFKSVQPSPNGAPRSTCVAMSPTPGHGGSSQACSNEYIVRVDRSTYGISEPIQVNVAGSSSSNMFRGVLITATSQSSGALVGTWSNPGEGVKLLTCNTNANDTAITHSSNNDKNQIQAIWTPPSTFINQTVVFKATIVKTAPVYYINCFSTSVFVQEGISTTTTPSGGSITSSASASASTSTSTAAATTTTTTTSSTLGMSVRWTFSNGITSIRMSVRNLKPSQWSALALSQDTKMGDDHVFICQRSRDDRITLERYINPGGYSRPTQVAVTQNVGGTFTVSNVAFSDGVVNCDFTLSNFANGKRQKRQSNIFILSQTASYNPLVAFGDLDSSNLLMRHFSKESLSKSVQLNRAETFDYGGGSGGNSDRLVKAHGIIMVFAWILLVSTGIIVAQFFKTAWPDTKIAGKALWFVIHSTVMGLATILTITGFILILVYAKGKWVEKTEKVEFAHSITGILVICFAMIQPIMAFFRPEPKAPRRFIFNIAHGFVGFNAFILSIVTLFLAMFFSRFNFDEKKEWGILVAWACWIQVMFLSLFTVDMAFRNRKIENQDHDTSSYELQERANNRHEIQENRDDMKNRIKTVFLFFHVLVALGLSILLAILIGKA